MPVINPGGSFTPRMMKFYVDLPNFPEWAIPFTKLIPKVYADDAHDLATVNTGDITTYFKYWWKHVGDNHWQIYCEMQMLIRVDYEYISTYVDVDLVVLNERVWEELNPNKV